jgi:hypothetical protein
MPEKLVVLDPTLEMRVPRVESAPRSGKITTLGLLDNGKPQSDILLRKVADLLTTAYPEIEIKYYKKPGAYRPAPSALLDEAVRECDALVVGIGD